MCSRRSKHTAFFKVDISKEREGGCGAVCGRGTEVWQAGLKCLLQLSESIFEDKILSSRFRRNVRTRPTVTTSVRKMKL